MTKRIILIGFVLLLTSCFPIETKNAEKAYKYWSGNNPSKEIKLIKGEYFQSPHFTLEYKVFLKFKSSKKWFDEFIQLNDLKVDTIGNDWESWTELPEWFKSNPDYLIYAKDPSNEFDRSRYLRNSESGICYIYETVGM